MLAAASPAVIRIDMHEYMEFMLIRSGKLKQTDVELIRESFKRLDKDGNGQVTRSEILPNYGEANAGPNSS